MGTRLGGTQSGADTSAQLTPSGRRGRLAGMAKRPSRQQLRYLKSLGYDGMLPKTSGEASAAIDAMRETHDVPAAERAIEEERILAAREQIKSAVVANLGTGVSLLGCLLKVSIASGLLVLIAATILWGRRDGTQDVPEASPIAPVVEKKQPRREVDDEKQAQTQLAAAKAMMAGNKEAAQMRLRDLIAKYPETRAAAEAAALLK